MADEIILRISESGGTRVASGMRRIEGSLNRMGRAGRAAGIKLSGSLGRAGSAMRRLVGIAGGLGVALGGKAILKFSDALGQLQADANLSTAEARKLRDTMLAVAKSTNVNKNELVAAAQEWQDYTGVLKKMIPQMGQVAKIHKATGVPMKELATISAALIKSLGMKPSGAVDALAKLNEQARAGSVNMRKAALVLPELLAGGAGYGFKGTRGVTQMGMLLQAVGGVYGGKAEEARTASLALMRELATPTKAKAKALKRMGIRVMEEDPTRPGQKRMRDIDKIMADIMKKTGGQIAGKGGLGQIFSFRAIKAALAFRQAGDINAYKAAGARGGMATIAEQLRKRLHGVGESAERVSDALNKLDVAFTKLGGGALAAAVKNPMLAGGAVLGGYGLMKSIGPLFRMLLGRRGKGGLGGVAAADGVTPVFVTNMPGAGIGGGATGIGGTAAAAGGAGKAGRLGAGVFAGAVGGGLLATEIGARAADVKLNLYRKVQKQRTAVHAQRMISQRVLSQAGVLAGLGKQGITKYGAAGSKQALTQENVMATLKASAIRQGADATTMAALLPILRQLTAALGKGTQVTVKAPGIDKPSVQSARGPKK